MDEFSKREVAFLVFAATGYGIFLYLICSLVSNVWWS